MRLLYFDGNNQLNLKTFEGGVQAREFFNLDAKDMDEEVYAIYSFDVSLSSEFFRGFMLKTVETLGFVDTTRKYELYHHYYYFRDAFEEFMPKPSDRFDKQAGNAVTV